MELIYLGCPFRHEDPNIQKKRCDTACWVAAQFIKQGYHVFSPLTHNVALINFVPEISGEHWLQFDLTILSICQRLFVLKLEGWETSKGLQQEIAFAKKKGIIIEEVEPPVFMENL